MTDTTPQRGIHRYYELVCQHRWVVVSGCLLVVFFFALGLLKIRINQSYRIFFEPDNPQLVALDNIRELYGSSDNVLLVLEAKSGDVFARENLVALREITDHAWQLPHVRRVQSVANFQYTRASEDDLLVSDLVESPGKMDNASIESVRQIATNDSLLLGKLIAQDGDVTGIDLLFNLESEGGTASGNARAEVYDAVNQFAASIEENYPGLTTHLTGDIMLNYSFEEFTKRDLETLIPLMYAVILIALAILFRSVVATGITLLVIVSSSVIAMGFMGWAGIPISPPTAVVPNLIMTLAVADGVHFLVKVLQGLRDGLERSEAVRRSLQLNFVPMMITSVTTTIGFLSMNLSDSAPFRQLGSVAAVGVMAAYILTITLVPIAARFLPLSGEKKRKSHGKLPMDQLSQFICRFRWRVLVGSGAAAALLSVFAFGNVANDRWLEYFSEDVPLYVDSHFAMDRLTGTNVIEYSLDSQEVGGVNSPAYLQHVENFCKWLEEQPGVLHVSAISETLMRLNKHMHGDSADYYSIPESRELAAQYLLLYEMSLPLGLDLNDRINVDRSSSRMVVTIENLSTAELQDLSENIVSWSTANTPAGFVSPPAGISTMFAYVSKHNIHQMVTGACVALAFITVTLMVAFRSARYGILCIFPNVLPVLAAFGVWGLLVGEIGLSLSVVAAITLGIIVDDTVHVISNYLAARRQRGMSPADAVRSTLEIVGPSLITTSLVLVAGFFTLSFSNFGVNAWMGQLCALTIVFALLIDLLFFPALLLIVDQPRDQRAPSNPKILSPGNQ